CLRDRVEGECLSHLLTDETYGPLHPVTASPAGAGHTGVWRRSALSGCRLLSRRRARKRSPRGENIEKSATTILDRARRERPGLRCDAATPLCCRCLPPSCAYHDRALCRLATLRLASCREPPAPGRLATVQVKAYSRSGKYVFTDNHTGLSGGGTAIFPYTVLPHGTPLEVQTLVRGVDDPRTDVVTLADTVHLRPDLVAWRLQAPDQSPIGAAVNLKGFVLERNGEVGARADCVLYVDGTAADRATGIWVDAGGMVACAMTHVFTEARTYSLELRVENVRPRDFDDTNNSVSASITALSPSGFS